MRLKSVSIVVAVVFLSMSPVLGDVPSTRPAQVPEKREIRVFEAYPDDLLERIRGYELLASEAAKGIGMAPHAVIRRSNKWRPGQTITVAFRGGDVALRRRIAEAASDWTKHANLTLDFGDVVGGKFREWSDHDLAYSAAIRIGFDQRGYWSVVGSACRNPFICMPHQASLNLYRLDELLPANWRAVVLHEFGHALGLEHEHQSPVGGCEDEFRWDDDSGYVLTKDAMGQAVPDQQGRNPGIYTVLGCPPNNWSKTTVDRNLRILKNSSAFDSSAFDAKSIMKYSFDDWMFRTGNRSRCFGEENLVLSTGDMKGIAKAYPKDRAEIESILQQQCDVIRAITRLELESTVKSHFRERLQLMEQRE